MTKSSKRKGSKQRVAKSGASSKGAKIIEQLRRKEGATLNDLTKATGWQAHSLRGFMSAEVSRRLGLKLESTKRKDGQRAYQIVS